MDISDVIGDTLSDIYNFETKTKSIFQPKSLFH